MRPFLLLLLLLAFFFDEERTIEQPTLLTSPRVPRLSKEGWPGAAR
jgi:hypothetical protein